MWRKRSKVILFLQLCFSTSWTNNRFFSSSFYESSSKPSRPHHRSLAAAKASLNCLLRNGRKIASNSRQQQRMKHEFRETPNPDSKLQLSDAAYCRINIWNILEEIQCTFFDWLSFETFFFPFCIATSHDIILASKFKFFFFFVGTNVGQHTFWKTAFVMPDVLILRFFSRGKALNKNSLKWNQS